MVAENESKDIKSLIKNLNDPIMLRSVEKTLRETYQGLDVDIGNAGQSRKTESSEIEKEPKSLCPQSS